MAAERGSAALAIERIEELAGLTEVAGQITRAYGTPSLVEAQRRIASWMEEAGLATRRDPLGSVTGRGGRASGPAVLLGSHADSVRNAGRFDGPLGILTALAAIERLGPELAGLASPIELVSFADEEGLRYRSSYLASRAYVGLLEAAELEEPDDDGISLAEAIQAMGGDPAGALTASAQRGDLRAYVEVHIEQGPVLEAQGDRVAVVTAIAGQSRGFVDIHGTAGHGGNTPPELRRDSLPAAAELVLAGEEAMRSTPGLVVTIGRIENEPNVGNVIPGTTTLSYDVRHQDDNVKHAAVDGLRVEANAIAARRGLEATWRHLQDHEAVAMDSELRERLRAAARTAGLNDRELPSGAGHDAVSLAGVAPVGMLFVRCRGGVSHHPDEHVEPDDIDAAIDVLAALLRGYESEPDGA